ncbi:RING finger protein 112-like isoform X2 [Chrysemys picta bellii]|uniref:RING finger protein 112-like isoform X2 n=1 Tax=Chrysemys picta bellii TaxID=8478 RepID=UPI0032B194F1
MFFSHFINFLSSIISFHLTLFGFYLVSMTFMSRVYFAPPILMDHLESPVGGSFVQDGKKIPCLSLAASQMFVHVAKEVRETCSLPPIQRLDLLVRDWQLSEAYGAEEGQEYLKDITQDLAASSEQPLVLGALRARGTRCYLLPHPGTGFTKSRAGTPGDMDEDFRQSLCDYISTVVRSAGTHVRMDRAGLVLTGAQLAARIKMAEAFAAMRKEKNSKAVEAARREYEQFVQELDRGHQSINCCLRVKPEEMKRRLEGKRRELLKHCQGQLWGEDTQKQAALKVLEQGLARKTSNH